MDWDSRDGVGSWCHHMLQHHHNKQASRKDSLSDLCQRTVSRLYLTRSGIVIDLSQVNRKRVTIHQHESLAQERTSDILSTGMLIPALKVCLGVPKLQGMGKETEVLGSGSWMGCCHKP